MEEYNSLAKTCLDAGTADAWTPVIDALVTDAGTAVQRIRHATWTTSMIKLINANAIVPASAAPASAVPAFDVPAFQHCHGVCCPSVLALSWRLMSQHLLSQRSSTVTASAATASAVPAF